MRNNLKPFTSIAEAIKKRINYFLKTSCLMEPQSKQGFKEKLTKLKKFWLVIKFFRLH